MLEEIFKTLQEGHFLTEVFLNTLIITVIDCKGAVGDIMLHDQDVEALIALGLTSSQAKVYLTLAKLEEARIQTISKTTQIARQDIYRIIAELEQRCLVEKVIATPTRFKAVPVHEAVPHLTQRMSQKALEAQEKAVKLTERHGHRIGKLKAQEREVEFVLISRREALSRRLKKAIGESQRSIELVCPTKKCLHALFDLSTSLRKALERDVKIRWIIDKSLESNSRPAILEVLSKSALFKMRCIPHNPTQTFSIYDKKILIVASNPKLHYLHSSALCTNATPIVELAQNHFSLLWNKQRRNRNGWNSGERRSWNSRKDQGSHGAV